MRYPPTKAPTGPFTVHTTTWTRLVSDVAFVRFEPVRLCMYEYEVTCTRVHDAAYETLELVHLYEDESKSRQLWLT